MESWKSIVVVIRYNKELSSPQVPTHSSGHTIPMFNQLWIPLGYPQMRTYLSNQKARGVMIAGSQALLKQIWSV